MIEIVQNGEKFIKCTLCSAKLRPHDKATLFDHLLGKKHKNILRTNDKDLRSIQKPEITEKAETISDLKKRQDDELQRNSTSIFIETVQNDEKFIKCTLCSAIMRPCDKAGMSMHLSGNKHRKLLQIHKNQGYIVVDENNLRSIQKPEITEKDEIISDLKKRLDDELQRNSTLTDYLTICKLIMNNVQDFSVQTFSETAISSQFTSARQLGLIL